MNRKLYYTPRSHFSRKVRILLAALNLDVELCDAGNVADLSLAAFGQNPLMKVPALIDEGQLIVESDHIAQYLVRRYNPIDTFNVLTTDIAQLNARAVMNGVMAAEVELILAQRAGIDTTMQTRYKKIYASICNGLDWLELHAALFPAQPCYLGFHLTAMFDHLVYYDLVPLSHVKLRERVDGLAAISYISQSAFTLRP